MNYKLVVALIFVAFALLELAKGRLLNLDRTTPKDLYIELGSGISTPCTHAAHHGKHAADGVTHYAGNYGNFLFLWDVLLRTAKITGRRPTRFGLENVEPATWQQELLWPFGKGRPR